MKLATLDEGGRDGTLVVVSRDLKRCVKAPRVAATLRMALDDWRRRAGDLALKPHYTVDTFSMALEAVRGKLAAAILPSFVVEAELASGRLATIFGPGIESASAYYFVRPRSDRNHFAVKAFGAWLQEEAGARDR